MNNKVIAVALFLTLAVSSMVVFVPSGSDGAVDESFVIKDSWNRDVSFDGPIEKIATFGTAFTVTAAELGFRDRIIMTDAYSLDAVKNLNLSKGYTFSTDIDEIGQKLADGEGGFDKNRDAVVIYGYASYVDGRDKLIGYGIKNVVGLYPSNYDGAIEVVSTIGKLFGISSGENVPANNMRDSKTYFSDELVANGIVEENEKRAAMYVGYTSSNFSAGNDASFTSSLMKLAGGRNVASDSSKASTYAIAPGDIELMGAEIVFLDCNYSKSIAEFRNEMHLSSDVKVYKLKENMNTYAPTAYDGISFMASAMYPEIFGSIDDQDEGGLADSMWYIAAIAAAIILIVAIVLVLRRNKTV